MKKAPRWMYSMYPTKSLHFHYSSHYKQEIENSRPKWVDRMDEIPDELSPSKVQPFLEYRTNLDYTQYKPGEDVHHLYWNTFLDSRMYNLEKLKEEDDKFWDMYVERNGYTPTEYMQSEQYSLRYGGPCDDPEYFVYQHNSFFRRWRKQYAEPEFRETCWYHDGPVPQNVTKKGRLEMNRDPDSPYKNLQGTYKHNKPCPLCRDWSLQINYRNVDLLRQFVDPKTGLQYPGYHTHLCKFKARWIGQAIEASRLLGYLEWPSADPDFSEWYVPDYQMSGATGDLQGDYAKRKPEEGQKIDYRDLND